MHVNISPDDSIDECYTMVNTEGSVFGHCGFDGAEYKPCLKRYATFSADEYLNRQTYQVILSEHGLIYTIYTWCRCTLYFLQGCILWSNTV